ncbi:molybdate ABC transporter substrate-binding protein [Aliiglaciecola sp. CAU 1673]|nr:molybdate ABC transporter substrate-binding protein [Aliiglaciecola sp. CAU 1673]MDF2177019.1 molybdate ABC transporter substrate-binding protein [Aliiglaciecola sp. CAU 1673]
MRGNSLLLTILLTLCTLPVLAKPLQVAVASNFKNTLSELVVLFEQCHGQKVVLSSGASGKQYAQIRQGASFDAFFAADSERPKLLELNGHVVTNSRFTYALGRLALWTKKPELMPLGYQSLEAGYQRLAIANPKLAPYGQAAQQALVRLGLWDFGTLGLWDFGTLGLCQK